MTALMTGSGKLEGGGKDPRAMARDVKDHRRSTSLFLLFKNQNAAAVAITADAVAIAVLVGVVSMRFILVFLCLLLPLTVQVKLLSRDYTDDEAIAERQKEGERNGAKRCCSSRGAEFMWSSINPSASKARLRIAEWIFCLKLI